MALHGVRGQDRLDGASNFAVWKAKILSVLDMNRVKNFALKVIAIPVDPMIMTSTRKRWQGPRALSLMGSRIM